MVNPEQDLGYGSVGSTQVNLSQHYNKNNYYHRFKILNGVDLRQNPGHRMGGSIWVNVRIKPCHILKLKLRVNSRQDQDHRD